jgi:hypothetical protein
MSLILVPRLTGSAGGCARISITDFVCEALSWVSAAALTRP